MHFSGDALTDARKWLRFSAHCDKSDLSVQSHPWILLSRKETHSSLRSTSVRRKPVEHEKGSTSQ